MIIDTDGGVDDAMAIILAVRSPEVDLRAITTVAGNTNVEQATRNVCTVLDIADATVPEVAIGAARPIIGPTLDAGEIHGNDGLGGLDRFMDADGSPRYPAAPFNPSDRTAVEVLLEAARIYGPELTLVSIGPLTNIALAVRQDPKAMSSIGRMVTMGGSTSAPGNVTPTAEFNIWADPEGAAMAFEGMPRTTLIGLNVTHQVPLFRDFVAPVVGVGKISDIYYGQGVTDAIHSEGNIDGMRLTLEALSRMSNGLLMTNLVDFDMLFGHRRDPVGYAQALVDFDNWIPSLLATLDPEEDLVMLTADHGNDPTFEGTDHTREYVPLMAFGPPSAANVDLGTRQTMSDLGATVCDALGAQPPAHGESFLAAIKADK